jgi:threonine dehydrogenase-like Zn-dependent dehydrogenase
VRLQPPQPGDVVLVMGPGPVGLLAGRVARAFGARVLVAGTPSDSALRLPAAQTLGLEPLDPAVPLSDALVGPVDLVLECSGAAAALDAALHAVKRGGGITLVGMPSAPVPLDVTQALRSELALRATYFGTWHDFERSLALIADGTIPAELLLAPYSLDRAVDGFADAAAQRVLKPLVQPGVSRPRPRLFAPVLWWTQRRAGLPHRSHGVKTLSSIGWRKLSNLTGVTPPRKLGPETPL